MKNSIFKTVLFIALCGGFAACKKEEKVEVVTFPLELTHFKTVIKNQVRLFANGKEINDQKIISNFLGEDIKWFTSTNFPMQKMGKLKFTSQDTLEFPSKFEDEGFSSLIMRDPWEFLPLTTGSPKPVQKNIKYTIEKNNNQILFYSVEPIFMNMNYLGYQLLKHTTYSIPFPDSPNTSKERRKMLVGYGTYNEITMSYLLYKYYDSSNHFTATGTTSNEFNENIIYSLGARDTVAVTTYSIHYKKM
ncbi:MAG: hypothetical protein EAZ15_04645 [Sphingobacteriales bacterium]|nr:MAG: hypothetical protein EAZ15_04645 [Sphingobacteriales bacterium]